MNRLCSILIIIGLLLISSCRNKQENQVVLAEKSVGEIFAEAYQNKDWETIVSIGDTLIGETDTMNMTIAYAEALATLGNPQKAIIALDKRIVSNPDDYNLYQTKGNVYWMMGKCDSAIFNYEKVVSMNPYYARPYMYEGEIYELIGDREKAISNYLIAAKLFAENYKYQEAIEFGGRVLFLDSTNIEAKEILDAVQKK